MNMSSQLICDEPAGTTEKDQLVMCNQRNVINYFFIGNTRIQIFIIYQN